MTVDDADEGDERLVLVRYGELAIKGKNRSEFEKALARNIVSAAAAISPVEVERLRGRMVVHPKRRAERVARRLVDVFGIASLSVARRCSNDVDSIAELAERELTRALDEHTGPTPIPFRVRTRRSDKRHPLTSTEIDKLIADRVLPARADRLRVDLDHAELVLGIEVRERDAFVFAGRERGLGGLPVGTLGKAVCLLSGGIDSPVAAWMAMKRGCDVVFASFHSAPYIGEGSRRKIVQLVKRLGRWQPRSRVASIPFTAIQEAIRDSCPEGYRTVLYRRSMQRLATELAGREGAGCLVTGESLGQVASQTMENLTCIGAAAKLPVLRPLICFDKQETIDIARRLGTFEISNLPEPDCCTVFLPARPVIRGVLSRCLDAEARIPLTELEANAFEHMEVTDV